MEGNVYYIAVTLIALFSFQLYRTNNTILMGILVTIGIYIVYSHESGNTATQWKRDAVSEMKKSSEDWAPEYDTGDGSVKKATKAPVQEGNKATDVVKKDVDEEWSPVYDTSDD